MALIVESKESLYGGVNQQSADHRLSVQVEESINAYPTLDSGLLKRNPTSKLDLSNSITYSEEMWTYEYDRGLSGISEEKYAVNILASGMEIINVITGKVYKEGSGLTYSGNAKSYLSPFVANNGFAGVTIKDNTFILNKNIVPQIDNMINNTTGGSTSTVTAYKSTIGFKTPSRLWDYLYDAYPNWAQKVFAPTKVSAAWQGSSMGSTTSVSVDGVIISYTIPRDTAIAYGNVIDTWLEYKANLYSKIAEALPSNLYVVTAATDSISIQRLDGTAIAVGFSISFLPLIDDAGNPYADTYPVLDSVEGDYYTGITSTTSSVEYTVTPLDYRKDGFYWISSANPSTAYTYSVSAVDELNNTVVASTSTDTTSNAAASSIAIAINANANFSAVANGSVVRITALNADMKSVTSYDSYGNQASFSWSNEVANANELPNDLGFDATVKVVGDIDNKFVSYWLEFIEGVWKETLDPYSSPIIVDDYMPHVLTRNANDTFTLGSYGKWSDRLVGDDDTNPFPTFVASDDNGAPKIKDIFFFKNRLGFITERTVVMSEVGKYGNFWRTTAVTVLDSDPIDTVADTTKAIQLEYATYIEDSVMLFSDKAQFKLSGGAVLSPKSIQITQTSAYEINKSIRPVYMNDKIFFASVRGDYSAIMQYQIKNGNITSEAIDISSHVQSYIPATITKLSGSAINNMLFVSQSTPDADNNENNTIFVYKYYDNGDSRVQSAWFKWTYNGSIFGAFSLGKNLNVLISRNQASAVTDWVLGSGTWIGSKLWTGDGIWYGSPSALTTSQNFETQPIHPQSYLGEFIDASEIVEDEDTIIGLSSLASASIVEYELSTLLIADVVVMIDTDATGYTLSVTTNLDVYSTTNSSITVARNTLETITGISIDFDTPTEGSVLTSIGASYTGVYSELLYNGDFRNGTINWTYTNWDELHPTKDIGSLIPSNVNIGEWVAKSGDKALTNGNIKMKTVQVESEEGSSFDLLIHDVSRDTIRRIKKKFTVARKPMVYGDSRNIRINITNSDTLGYRINSVALEGNYNARNKNI